jgi:hypothetical protein
MGRERETATREGAARGAAALGKLLRDCDRSRKKSPIPGPVRRRSRRIPGSLFHAGRSWLQESSKTLPSSPKDPIKRQTAIEPVPRAFSSAHEAQGPQRPRAHGFPREGVDGAEIPEEDRGVAMIPYEKNRDIDGNNRPVANHPDPDSLPAGRIRPDRVGPTQPPEYLNNRESLSCTKACLRKWTSVDRDRSSRSRHSCTSSRT